MITIYPREQLGAANYGWLDTRYHFSFANYYNKDRIHFGALRVINDDKIAAAQGFPPHDHDNMEIITYVRSGAVLHRDSLGNEGRTGAGDVQVMSAGTGITHAEYSDPDVETILYQIWIFPRDKNVTPRWEQRAFPKESVSEALPLLVSGDRADSERGALYIHQDARIYGGALAVGATITHPITHQAYVLVMDQPVEIDGEVLYPGDGAEIIDQKSVVFRAGDVPGSVLVIDVPRRAK